MLGRPAGVASTAPGRWAVPGRSGYARGVTDSTAAPAEMTSATPVTAGLTVRFLRRLAVLEAIAFLTLILIGVLHAVTHGWGEALFVMGNVHGAVFTTYLITIFAFHRKLDWGPLTLLLVLVAGFIPGGGIMAERWALADSHLQPPGQRRRFILR